MTRTKKWTMLAYLAGDNNLAAAGEEDIEEMKQVGSTEEINAVVQFDNADEAGMTRRYCLHKGTTAAKDVVQSLGKTNTGDPKVLRAFIEWGVKNYPADHYLLVLWNHGSGWDDSNLYHGDYLGGAAPPVSRKGTKISAGAREGKTAEPLAYGVARAGLRRSRRALFVNTVRQMMSTRAIAFDDAARDFLDNMEMKSILMDMAGMIGRKIDVVGFDACLMSMVEVAYQIKGTADYCVGSEETEPGDGWPYDRILKRLAAEPSMSPADLSKTITREYMASYKRGEDVTLSASDLSALEPLAASIDALAKKLRNAVNGASTSAAVVTARLRAQEYSEPYDDYCDLVDVCSLLSHYVPDLACECDAVKAAAAGVVIENGFQGAGMANSHGLSIYFPKKRMCRLYSSLDFVKNNAWPSFLSSYLSEATRRPPLS